MLFCALLHFTDPTEGQSPGSGVVRKPGVLSASHEISSITRLCPLPLQEVKNRFTLFYHQRVKRFFKNLYLEATSGKQLEKLPPLHDKKKKKDKLRSREGSSKGSHVLWQRDFTRTQPSYRGKKQWKCISLTYINTNIHPE